MVDRPNVQAGTISILGSTFVNPADNYLILLTIGMVFYLETGNIMPIRPFINHEDSLLI